LQVNFFVRFNANIERSALNVETEIAAPSDLAFRTDGTAFSLWLNDAQRNSRQHFKVQVVKVRAAIGVLAGDI
jgi:hypothetical protein